MGAQRRLDPREKHNRKADLLAPIHIAVNHEYLHFSGAAFRYGYKITCKCGYVTTNSSTTRGDARLDATATFNQHLAREVGLPDILKPSVDRENLTLPVLKHADQIVPDHYGGADNPREVIKVLREHLTPEEFIGFLKGNVCKYELRAKKKNGIVDLKKAQYYQNYLVAFMEDMGLEN